MAPGRVKKTRHASANDPAARSQTIAVKSPIRTPVRSPQKKPMGITEGQKQALVDNLQLEITERARKLRAQYALQAQSLRTRIELRINRIPKSLRKANMGELLERHLEMSQPKQTSAAEPAKAEKPINRHIVPQNRIVISEDAESAPALRSKGTKRKSDAMVHADKENSDEPAHSIPNPKRRLKGNAAQSRQVTNPSTVLSPKSANSRTLPQSPLRPGLGSPRKSYTSQPASSLKPYSPMKAASPAKTVTTVATATLASMLNEKPKAGRPKAATGPKATTTMKSKVQRTRTKREAENTREPAHSRKVSNSSNTSSASTGTTIVKNPKKAPAAVKKNDVVARATGKKVAAAVEGSSTGRRVLRKR